MQDLLSALPAALPAKPVSLLEALPDPNERSFVPDAESHRTVLHHGPAHPQALSAIEEYAVAMHAKESALASVAGASASKKKRKAAVDPLPKKTKLKRARGKQIKQRKRSNQR